MYFFLKEPKSCKDTLIYLIYYVKKQGRNFKYSTGQKTHPEDWNFETRLPKSRRGASGVKAKHLSCILSQYSTLLEKTIQHCESDNTPITCNFLKTVFDKHFKDKESGKKIENLVDVVQNFIDTRSQSGGQSACWMQKYTNLKKNSSILNSIKIKSFN